MLIGVVSDTHGWLHPRLPEVLAGCDLIVHAGDVGRAEILDVLAEIAPVRAVYGNVDGPPVRGRWPEWDRFEAGGLRFVLTHIGGRPGKWAAGVGEVLRRERPDVFVCGHSHILCLERVPDLGGTLYLNPGAAGREGFHQVKTCVRLHVEDGRAQKAEVAHLDEGVGR